jgi:hypothetical protein
LDPGAFDVGGDALGVGGGRNESGDGERESQGEAVEGLHRKILSPSGGTTAVESGVSVISISRISPSLEAYRC